MPTVHLIIKGKVQGVFYRASAKMNAKALSLTGWVKNNGNGDVEAMVTGPQEQLKLFIDWCWQGPKDAAVAAVIETVKEEILFDSFTIER